MLFTIFTEIFLQINASPTPKLLFILVFNLMQTLRDQNLVLQYLKKYNSKTSAERCRADYRDDPSVLNYQCAIDTV